MKALLDSCVWGGVASTLTEAGHDVVWAGAWNQDPGDAEILALAFQEGRVLVTLDKDFGELAVLRRQPHNGIVRLVNVPAQQQGSLCVLLLERYGSELATGAILTAEAGRVRIRSGDG